MPEEMARAVTVTAQSIGESIVHLIETEGIELMERQDLAELRAAAADAPTGVRVISVRCQTCRTELVRLRIGKTDETLVNSKLFLRALADWQTKCPHT